MKKFICTRSTNSDILVGKVIKGELFHVNGKKYILLKDSFNGEYPRCTFFNYNTPFALEGDAWEWAELNPCCEEEESMFLGLNVYRVDYTMCGAEHSVRVEAESKLQAPFKAGLTLGHCLANIEDVVIQRVVLEKEAV